MMDIMKNMFHKPKVLFMLTVVCLSSFAVFHNIISATPPDPCPALEAAWQAAINASIPYYNAFINAYNAWETAYQAFCLAEINRIEKLEAFQVAGIALAAAIAAGASGWIIAALTLNLWRCDSAYKMARKIRDIKQAQVIQAEKDYIDARDAYLPYLDAIKAAKAAYYAAGCGD